MASHVDHRRRRARERSRGTSESAPDLWAPIAVAAACWSGARIGRGHHPSAGRTSITRIPPGVDAPARQRPGSARQSPRCQRDSRRRTSGPPPACGWTPAESCHAGLEARAPSSPVLVIVTDRDGTAADCWRASTWPTCCWRSGVARRARARRPAWRSARRAPASSGSCVTESLSLGLARAAQRGC